MYFIDTNIFMYAAGKAHPAKERCLKMLSALAGAPNAHEYCINSEVLQEILHRYKALRVPEIGFKLFDGILNLGLVIHAVEARDIGLARQLLGRYPALSTRDAVHLAVAERRKVDAIITLDKDFLIYPHMKICEPSSK